MIARGRVDELSALALPPLRHVHCGARAAEHHLRSVAGSHPGEQGAARFRALAQGEHLRRCRGWEDVEVVY